MESQRDDPAHIRTSWRMARSDGGAALLPTQDEEDRIPGPLLDDRIGVARFVLDCFAAGD